MTRRLRELAAVERTPDRPGPGPVPPTVLRSLDLAVLKRVESLVPGEHLTPQTGQGTELAMIRPYHPGDDVRHIDWNATARLQEPYVRVHVGERALTTWLVLDASATELGVISAAQWLPFLVLALPLGVVIDRHRRRRMLILSEIARAICMAALVGCLIAGALNLPLLLVAVVVLGTFAVLYEVGYQSAIPALVPRAGQAAARV